MFTPDTGDVMLTLPGNSGGFGPWQFLIRSNDRLYGYYPGYGAQRDYGKAKFKSGWACTEGLIKIGEL